MTGVLAAQSAEPGTSALQFAAAGRGESLGTASDQQTVMPRHIEWHPLCRPIGIVSVFLAVTVWLLRDQPTHATPYETRAETYPFDRDWLEVSQVLAKKCAGCHRAGMEQTDLTTYAEVIAGKTDLGDRLVVPGDPESSLLWQQCVWNHDESPQSEFPDEPSMPPPPEERLTAGQLQTLRRWIENGALEYTLPDTCSTRPLLEIDFPSAKECKVCHPRQYEQWSSSMHAYAQHSPVMEAFTLTLNERTSGTIGTFCTRCHTPIGIALGETSLTPNVRRSRISMEGVTCVVCHRVSRPYYKANTRMSLQPGRLLETCMFGPFDDPETDPLKVHAAEGRPHFKSAEFCGACHDVTNPVGVRLEEAFSEWRNSPAAKDGVTCQHCHMGPVPGVPVLDHQRPLGRAAEIPGVDPERLPLRHLSDHSFAGPDYSLLPDTEFPHKLDWMYETDYRDTSKLTEYQRDSLNALRRENRRLLRDADGKRYQLLRNAARIEVTAPETAVVGERIKIRVDVKSLFAGHNFPTGFTAERQAWVELTVFDSCGRPVFQSGDLDHNHDLRDEHSHEVEAGKIHYDKYLLNFQSKFVTLTNKGTERSVVIPVNRHLAPLNVLRPADGISASFGRPLSFRVSKSSVPPLETMGQTYPIRLTGCSGEYRVKASLNYRHLPAGLFDKIGVPQLKHLLEVVVIDEYDGVIYVEPKRRR